MGWFNNHYECDDCGCKWEDEWSCTCDDDCPNCGARHMSPVRSDDLTEIIQGCNGSFQVLVSPESAEDAPDYEVLEEFETRGRAEAFLSGHAIEHP